MTARSTPTPGQLAYEEDRRRRPTYDGGTPRQPWAKLSAIARASWERKPEPRDWSQWQARQNAKTS